MAENSKIEWTDHTFNPWIGCTRISEGCNGCYAAVSTPARAMKVAWGATEQRHRTAESTWKQPVKWERGHAAFFAEHGRRQRVFCASLADVFDNAVDPLWRAELFDLIADTPNLDWLLLTKRIGNVRDMLPPWWEDGAPNVWLGATVVNQEEADRDIPKLVRTPARVRFLSVEPMLGPIYLLGLNADCRPVLADLDWIIVGGESGHGARAMHPDWPRSLRDQCAAAGVPFLFKQWGAWLPRGQVPSGDPEKWTRNYFDELGVDSLNYGKKAAGRLLDGVQHDGFPL